MRARLPPWLSGDSRRTGLFLLSVPYLYTSLIYHLAGADFGVPAAHDHAVGALVLACAITLGERSPRADRVASRCRFTFTAAMRVIYRVHSDTAHGRPDAAPAHCTGFTDRTQAVFFVANLADRRTAIDVHFANFARTQTQLRVFAFARQQLDCTAGCARELRALTGHHFDAVYRRADRNIPERHCVARLDRRIRTVLHLRADGQTFAGDDVTALAIRITQQR